MLQVGRLAATGHRLRRVYRPRRVCGLAEAHPASARGELLSHSARCSAGAWLPGHGRLGARRCRGTRVRLPGHASEPKWVAHGDWNFRVRERLIDRTTAGMLHGVTPSVRERAAHFGHGAATERVAQISTNCGKFRGFGPSFAGACPEFAHAGRPGGQRWSLCTCVRLGPSSDRNVDVCSRACAAGAHAPKRLLDGGVCILWGHSHFRLQPFVLGLSPHHGKRVLLV